VGNSKTEREGELWNQKRAAIKGVGLGISVKDTQKEYRRPGEGVGLHES